MLIHHRVCAIAVTISVSLSTGEHSFSAPKREKTPIRSSMVQERHQPLLSMSIEPKILLKCDKGCLIHFRRQGILLNYQKLFKLYLMSFKSSVVVLNLSNVLYAIPMES